MSLLTPVAFFYPVIIKSKTHTDFFYFYLAKQTLRVHPPLFDSEHDWKMEVGEVLEFFTADRPFAEVSRLAVVTKTWKEAVAQYPQDRTSGRGEQEDWKRYPLSYRRYPSFACHFFT